MVRVRVRLGYTMAICLVLQHQVSPYISENPSGPLRSRKQTTEDVQHYLETGSTRNGVLGPSWFGCLRYFDPIRGTAVDYMHGCLLGVMRRLFHLWLSPENHKKPFSGGESAKDKFCSVCLSGNHAMKHV